MGREELADTEREQAVEAPLLIEPFRVQQNVGIYTTRGKRGREGFLSMNLAALPSLYTSLMQS